MFPLSPAFIVIFLIAAVIAGAALLFDRLFGRAGDRRLRRVLPPVLALAAAAVWTLVPSRVWSLAAMILAISLVAAAGIITPLPFIDRPVSRNERTLAIVCSSIVFFPLVIALLVNPEVWAGGPAPLLADRIPIFGWLFDPIADAVPQGTPAFDMVFSALLWIGFYLEAVLIAAIVYGVFLIVAGRCRADRT